MSLARLLYPLFPRLIPLPLPLPLCLRLIPIPIAHTQYHPRVHRQTRAHTTANTCPVPNRYTVNQRIEYLVDGKRKHGVIREVISEPGVPASITEMATESPIKARYEVQEETATGAPAGDMVKIGEEDVLGAST
ncbi:hypothetical protein EDC01DRAFT_779448 [Geopyxis carbonaria]|nr:hypothetical protein EDC01DRAFT_779448 [Geopyxis carbonaria]